MILAIKKIENSLRNLCEKSGCKYFIMEWKAQDSYVVTIFNERDFYLSAQNKENLLVVNFLISGKDRLLNPLSYFEEYISENIAKLNDLLAENNACL